MEYFTYHITVTVFGTIDISIWCDIHLNIRFVIQIFSLIEKLKINTFQYVIS